MSEIKKTKTIWTGLDKDLDEYRIVQIGADTLLVQLRVSNDPPIWSVIRDPNVRYQIMKHALLNCTEQLEPEIPRDSIQPTF
jgi:hypothetical protein